ncbi:MAG: tetrathionate reductase, partial [Rhodospirillaceae bacterium BRH_c57]
LLGGLLGLGLALPAALALVAGQSRTGRALAGLAAVFGAFLFRWELFTGAQLMSKTESAFFGHASLTAADTLRAAAGSAGVLVLAILAVIILFTVLAPRGGRQTHA